MFRQIRKAVSIIILVAFISTTVKSPAYAQVASQGKMPWMPQPGVMVHLSPEFTPAHLQGLTIHPDNALQFDFLVNRGDDLLADKQKKEEYTKLVKYFLVSLTIPDEDQWVNLSPYEKDRIVQKDFAKTEMGRDLLAQDYLLKQITSSLIYPEEGLGKKFWDKIYQRAWSEFHTTNIPVNTFNKVWIVPDQALVYESGDTAYILRSHLKVMLEEDYLSLSKHLSLRSEVDATHFLGSQVIREIILPELEREVNEGKNFANLRQMYSGMVLATWYKQALKESLLGKIYADKAKVKGVDQDPQNNKIIYQKYLQAFKKGVFNYIKEDVDKYANETIPRKYFSGGFVDHAMEVDTQGNTHLVPSIKRVTRKTLKNVLSGMPSATRRRILDDLKPRDLVTVTLDSLQENTPQEVLKEHPKEDNPENVLNDLRPAKYRFKSWLKRMGGPQAISPFLVYIKKIPQSDIGRMDNGRRLTLDELLRIYRTLSDEGKNTTKLTDQIITAMEGRDEFKRLKPFLRQGNVFAHLADIAYWDNNIGLKKGSTAKANIAFDLKTGEFVIHLFNNAFDLETGEFIIPLLKSTEEYKIPVGSDRRIAQTIYDSVKESLVDKQNVTIKMLRNEIERLKKANESKPESDPIRAFLDYTHSSSFDQPKIVDMGRGQHFNLSVALVIYRNMVDDVNKGGLYNNKDVIDGADQIATAMEQLDQFKELKPVLRQKGVIGYLADIDYNDNNLGWGGEIHNSDARGKIAFDLETGEFVIHLFNGISSKTGYKIFVGSDRRVAQDIYESVEELFKDRSDATIEMLRDAIIKLKAEKGIPELNATTFEAWIKGMGQQAIIPFLTYIKDIPQPDIVQMDNGPATLDDAFRKYRILSDEDGDITSLADQIVTAMEGQKEFQELKPFLKRFFGYIADMAYWDVVIGWKEGSTVRGRVAFDLEQGQFVISLSNTIDSTEYKIPVGSDRRIAQTICDSLKRSFADRKDITIDMLKEAIHALTEEDVSELDATAYDKVTRDKQLEVVQLGRKIAGLNLKPGDLVKIRFTFGSSTLTGTDEGTFVSLTPVNGNHKGALVLHIRSVKRIFYFEGDVASSDDRLNDVDRALMETRLPGQNREGGIDFNAANLNLQIKRDGHGVPLPLAQQDMAQLSLIQGFEPEIIEIRPAVNTPIISELQQKLQSSSV